MWGIQTSTLDHQMDMQAPELDQKYEVLDQPTRLALAWAEAAKESSLALQLRYANSHRRAYEKSLALLLQLQADRKKPVVQASEPCSSDGSTQLPNEPNPNSEHLTTDSAKEPNLKNEHPVIELLSCSCGRIVRSQLGPEPIICACGKIIHQPSGVSS